MSLSIRFSCLLHTILHMFCKPTVKSHYQVTVLTNYFALTTNGTKYLRKGQLNFVGDSLLKIWRGMICLSRSHPFKFVKGFLPHILLGPFLNTLSQVQLTYRLIGPMPTTYATEKISALVKYWHCTKKLSFLLLRISSVNVTKSAVTSGFGHIYWRNP